MQGSLWQGHFLIMLPIITGASAVIGLPFISAQACVGGATVINA